MRLRDSKVGEAIKAWMATWPGHQKQEVIKAQPGVSDVTDYAAKSETLLGRAKRKSGYQDTRIANDSWYKSTLGEEVIKNVWKAF